MAGVKCFFLEGNTVLTDGHNRTFRVFVAFELELGKICNGKQNYQSSEQPCGELHIG